MTDSFMDAMRTAADAVRATHVQPLAEAARLAEAAAHLPLLIEAPRQATLKVNGPSVHIAGTPAHLRVSNASGFEATVTATVQTAPGAPGHTWIIVDSVVTTINGLDWTRISSTAHGQALYRVAAPAGTTLAEWYVFQEARRRKRKGPGVRYGYGPAHFRFHLYIPDEI